MTQPEVATQCAGKLFFPVFATGQVEEEEEEEEGEEAVASG